MSSEYERVRREIERRMQAGSNVSADAYEDDGDLLPPDEYPGLEENDRLLEADLPELLRGSQPVEVQPESEFIDECGTDLFPDANSVAPKPIDGSYLLKGPVQDFKELHRVWDAFRSFRYDGKEEVTVLLSKQNLVVKSRVTVPGQAEVTDPIKGLRYVSEEASVHNSHVANHEDLFIWVLNTDSNEDMGYIHRAYVFMKRK